MGQLVSLPSYIVDRRDSVVSATDELPKTTAPHGVTWQEIQRLDGAMHFMEKHCGKGRLWWATVDKGSSHEFIDQVWKRITNLQRAERLPPYRAIMRETRGGLHGHIVFVGNRHIAEKLQRSAALGSKIDVKKIYDPAGLVSYLAKERTPQANYRRHSLGGRIKGPHRLEGGGDRVRLSDQLKDDAIAARYIEPWSASNAKRSYDRKEYRKRALNRKAPRAAGQILLFPEFEKPVNRLHQFGGGWIPPAVAKECEFRRRQLGLSQRVLASMIGLSQGQYANVTRGHDPISARATSRLRDLLLGGRRETSQLEKHSRNQRLIAKGSRELSH
jgi:hypothetical protein